VRPSPRRTKEQNMQQSTAVQTTAGYELLRPVASLSSVDTLTRALLTHVQVTYPDGQRDVLCGAKLAHSVVWPMDPREVTCHQCTSHWWSGQWEVLRHSGHLSTQWRHVYVGSNGRGALECYVHKHEQLLHGGLRLQRNGVLVASAWAPQRQNL
jgi:hypothetical protein